MAAELAKRRRRYAYGAAPGSNAYEGSAARRLEGQVRTRPQVRPRERVVARPRVRVREAGRVSVFAVVGFAAVALCAVLLMFGYVQLSQISDQVVELENQITTLKSEEAQLRVQYELAYDLSAIEAAVTADGSMVRPEESQIIYVDLSAPDSVELFGETETGTGFVSLLASVKDIFGTVVEYFR